MSAHTEGKHGPHAEDLTAYADSTNTMEEKEIAKVQPG